MRKSAGFQPCWISSLLNLILTNKIYSVFFGLTKYGSPLYIVFSDRYNYNRKGEKNQNSENKLYLAPYGIDFCLSHATVVKISDEELPLVTQALFPAECGVEGAVAAIKERYGQVKLVLITCGAQGAACYDLESGLVYRCPAEASRVVSTVGAGDSFGAAFLSYYKKTGDIPRAWLSNNN